MDFLHSLQGNSDDENDNNNNEIEFEPTLNIDKADFIVAHGSGVIRGIDNDNNSGNNDNSCSKSMGNFINDGNFDSIDQILQQCANRKLPMICANPDFIVKYHDGTTKNMPGQIAQRYIHKFHMKEQTIIFGKPNKSHFDACIKEI